MSKQGPDVEPRWRLRGHTSLQAPVAGDGDKPVFVPCAPNQALTLLCLRPSAAPHPPAAPGKCPGLLLQTCSRHPPSVPLPWGPGGIEDWQATGWGHGFVLLEGGESPYGWVQQAWPSPGPGRLHWSGPSQSRPS